MSWHGGHGEIRYIDCGADLAKLVQEIETVERVALDTEADSLHHYREKICLVQVSFNDQHYLVDPLAGIDLQPLLKVLAERLLVLHGADYDLRMLSRGYGFRAGEIFDTMLAAQLLGYEQLGLASLVERHCGVTLDKHGQKADWSKRPLSEELLEYATNDTRHLLCLADRLEAELVRTGRREWFREVCQRLVEVAGGCSEPKKSDGSTRIRGLHRLSSQRARRILEELWRWREREAEKADLPPFKILRPETMVELAAWADSHPEATEWPQLPRNIRGARLERFLRAVEKGRHGAIEKQRSQDRRRKSESPTHHSAQLFSALRRIRDELAQQLSLAPSVLCSNAILAKVAEKCPTSPDALEETTNLCRWQIELLGQEFLRLCQQFSAALRDSSAKRSDFDCSSALLDSEQHT